MLFSASWFETLFAKSFSLRHLACVWDFLFVFDSAHNLFSTAIALLTSESQTIIQDEAFESLVSHLKHLGKTVTEIDPLLRLAEASSSSVAERVQRFHLDYSHPLTEKDLCF